MRLRAVGLLGFSWLLAACGEPAPDAVPAPAAAAEPAPAGDEVLVVFLGDSLTAGYGLDSQQAFPALVAEKLRAAGKPVRVVNAGISGDTTAGGLARLDWLLRQEPDVLVVSLGANDGLRGLELDDAEENLRRIVSRARAEGIRVLLSGMMIPTNYGPEYTERFAALFPALAAELEVPLVPFLLDGVAARPELNLPDGIHPNADGQKRVAETMFVHLEPVVDEVLRERVGG